MYYYGIYYEDSCVGSSVWENPNQLFIENAIWLRWVGFQLGFCNLK